MIKKLKNSISYTDGSEILGTDKIIMMHEDKINEIIEAYNKLEEKIETPEDRQIRISGTPKKDNAFDIIDKMINPYHIDDYIKKSDLKEWCDKSLNNIKERLKNIKENDPDTLDWEIADYNNTKILIKILEKYFKL